MPAARGLQTMAVVRETNVGHNQNPEDRTNTLERGHATFDDVRNNHLVGCGLDRVPLME